MPFLTRIVLLLAFAGVAVFLFIRATAGGGPIYYFLSAVFVGMAIASLQRGQSRPGQRGRDGRGSGGRDPRGKGG